MSQKFSIFDALGGTIEFFNQCHQQSLANEANERARAQEIRQIANEARINKQLEFEAASRAEAAKTRRFVESPPKSKVLGGSRLGTLADAKKDGLLNPNGLYLGYLEGRPIYYSGEDHMLNYGKTRSGKGTDIVLPNLGHVFDRSFLVNDIKDGENAYASAEYRAWKGQRVIGIDPHGLNIKGVKRCRLNPFQRIINKAACGMDVSADCKQLCMSLCPPQKGDAAWIPKGATFILSTWLEWCAIYHPEYCKLSRMWQFVFKKFDASMALILECGNDKLEGQANKIIGWQKADKQWQAYETELTDALESFAPNSPLANVTDASDFDPADMREEKITVYLMADSDLLEASGRWASLTISAIVNTCAQTRGNVRVTCLIDELANLPYMEVLPKILTLYAGKGVQIYGLCQGRAALRSRGYKEDTIKNFESQSGIINVWQIKYEKDLLEDIERWSGVTTVAVKGVNQGGGTVESAGMTLTYQKRPLLQADDIFQIGKGKQIISTNGPYLYVADRVPWFKIRNLKKVLRSVQTLHGHA